MRGYVSAATFILAYLCLFFIANIIHFEFFPVEVVLYDTLADALIAAVLWFLIFALFLRRRFALSNLDATLAALVALLLAGSYAFYGPALIDRSLSVYFLEKIAQRGGAIRQDALAGIFTNEYVREQRLVDVRLTEQLASGTIEIENGCVRLTALGRTIAEVTRFYRTHILPKHRDIMGRLTDELTDPFRDSPPANYQCRDRDTVAAPESK